MTRFAIVIFLMLGYGCTPKPFLEETGPALQTTKPSSRKDSRVKTKKEKTKIPSTQSEYLGENGIPGAPLPAEEVSFFLKISDLNLALTSVDVQRLRKIVSLSEKSLLNRATLTLAALRCYLQVGANSSLFADVSLVEREPTDLKDWTALPSLEALSHELRIAFNFELDSNPFLQSYKAYDLALKALEKNREDTTAAASLHSVLGDRSALWVKIPERLTAIRIPPTPHADLQQPAPSSDPASITSQATPAPALKMDPAKNSEEAIKRAQDLLEQNKFQESFALLRSVDKNDSRYAAAYEKSQEVANKAVAELRMKAARAFQSSVPVTDLKAKVTYLEDAKQYLTTAIQLYPDSAQIGSVKQNLNVINKNIDLINGSSTKK